MADEAKIILTLEDKQILSEIKALGGGFDTLAKKIEDIQAPLGKIPKTIEKDWAPLMKGIPVAFDKTKESAKGLGDTVNGFAAKFVTFEMAKKMYSFADATLRSAKDMQGLSYEAKAGAQAYVDIADSVSRTGQGIILWGASLLAQKGAFGEIHDLAVETADAWAFAAGQQTQQQQKNSAANAAGEANADVVSALRELRGSRAAMDKAMQNEGVSDNYFDVVTAGLEDSQKKFDAAVKKAGYSVEQAKALIAGKSTTDIRNPVSMTLFSDQIKESERKGNEKQTTNTVKQTKELDWEKEQSDRLDKIADLEDLKQKQKEEGEKALLESHKKIQDEKLAYDLKINEELENDNEKIRKENAEARDAEFQAQVEFADAMGGLFEVLGKKNKSLALASMTTSELVAGVNMFEGVSKAYAQGGILGFLTGGAVLAKGATIIASIEQRKQQLDTGGLINGRRVSIIANETGQESVANARATRDYYPVIQAMNSGASRSQVSALAGGGSLSTPNVVNVTFSPTYGNGASELTARRSMNEMRRVVKSIMTDPSFNRAQAYV